VTRLRAHEHDFERPADVPAGSIVTVLRVPPEAAGQRVDKFVQSQLRRTSRTRAKAILLASAYDPEGKRLRAGSRVRAEQHILLWRAPWDETAVPTELPILWEDEWLLAIDKPANLPVHPTARYHKNTLIKLLQAKRPGEWLSLGHRLDRETSGVILITKSARSDSALKKLLEARDDIEKTYDAITWGIPKGGAETHFRVDLPLELDPTSKTNVKMRVWPTGMVAGTRFEIVETRGTYARVKCDLETGRQHQIRIHLAALGTPIVGDKLYGPDETLFAKNADGEMEPDDWEKLELPRHALHAARLELPHPITGKTLVVEAPFPRDLSEFWEGLE
jgi:23S rRNA pseudouridine1911/1915/1917 synthase